MCFRKFKFMAMLQLDSDDRKTSEQGYLVLHFSNSQGKIMEASVKAVAGGLERDLERLEMAAVLNDMMIPESQFEIFLCPFSFTSLLFLLLPLSISSSPSVPLSLTASFPSHIPCHTHIHTYVHTCIFLTFFILNSRVARPSCPLPSYV